MKIAIISDTHDNIPNIDEALKIIKQEKIKTIIHCGDVCAPDVLKYLTENFNGEIHLVFGNVDGDQEEMKELNLLNVKIYGEVGELKINNLKIAFCHFPEEGEKLAESQKYNLVFHGHTHRPWEKTLGQTRLINPGTLAGLFAKPTFAIYDIDNNKLELKLLYS